LRRSVVNVEDAMRFVAIGLCALFLMAGCSNPSGDPGKSAPTAAATAAAHAAKDVKPGSYEDWCGEHGVPESQCTRCNPELIPAFKATKDWCEEHGLPESQCTKCNPGIKIVRPPKPSGG
jgi:hypothetical protein